MFPKARLRRLTPQILSPEGHVNVEQLLDGQGEALLVAHHRHVVQTIEVGQGLQVRLVLDQLLRAAVQQTDVRIRTDHRLKKRKLN